MWAFDRLSVASVRVPVANTKEELRSQCICRGRSALAVACLRMHVYAEEALHGRMCTKRLAQKQPSPDQWHCVYPENTARRRYLQRQLAKMRLLSRGLLPEMNWRKMSKREIRKEDPGRHILQAWTYTTPKYCISRNWPLHSLERSFCIY